MPGAVEDRAVVDKYAGAGRKVPGMEEMDSLQLRRRPIDRTNPDEFQIGGSGMGLGVKKRSQRRKK